ncbi:nucleolin-like [Colletes gigas]|uniref:nucleolin-like n=1 Tax=Colletes gigas TaxID=935657 RepID=UPI001C9B9354|nr:nucleolin-like [Colletes gigas]
MRAARFTEPCISTEGCIPSNVETFTFEGEPDSSNSVDSKEVYENYDRERFEDTLRYSESARPSLRRLLQARRLDEYGLRENRPSNKKLRNTRVYRSVLRGRSDDDADYDDKDEDDEEGDNDEGGDKADEDEEEEDEETVNDTESPRYYDYDSGGSSMSNSWISFATELVIVNILLRLAGV